MDNGKNFSPETWIRYWYFAAVLGIVAVVVGIILCSVKLIAVGVLLVVVTPPMVAFWRRVEAQRSDESNSS